MFWVYLTVSLIGGIYLLKLYFKFSKKLNTYLQEINKKNGF